jgi:hypothetical protein
MRPFFSRIDTNGDGAIDAKEVAAAQARRRQQNPGEGPGAGGPPGMRPPIDGAR